MYFWRVVILIAFPLQRCYPKTLVLLSSLFALIDGKIEKHQDALSDDEPLGVELYCILEILAGTV